MANYQRTEACNQCGDCCGGNGEHNTGLGWEVVRTWALIDVAESYNLWTLFGLGWNPVLEQIEPEADFGSYKIKGTNYYFVWQEIRPGKGHLPCKDISAGHDGSSYSVECPFLKADPGDGSRPCALVGSQDDGARSKFCRPEERPDYVPANDIYDERSKVQWETDHPNCSYVFVEIVE